MVKFIHAADIHLDSPLHRLEEYDGAPVEEIRRASRRAFEKLMDLALDESVDFVLIAGDLFDGDWKDYNTGLYFVSQVRRLRDEDIQVFIVSGNHDAFGQMTRRLPYPDNVHTFSHGKPETRILEELAVAIHGQSFPRAAVMDNLALHYPEPIPGCFNIGLLHTSLTGGWEGHENYAPCGVDDLLNKGYDYWALGHVHGFEMVSVEPPVVFPGSIQGRHIRETGAKGCVFVTVEEGAPPEITRHFLDVIRWERITVDLTGVLTLDEALIRFQDAFQPKIDSHQPLPVIARVEFVGEIKIHTRLVSDPDYLKESVRSAALTAFGGGAWIEKVKVKTRSNVDTAFHPGPMGELDSLVEDIKSSRSELVLLGEELGPLLKKLPSDYRQGEGGILLDDPVRIGELVDQAHALLVQRLKKETL